MNPTVFPVSGTRTPPPVEQPPQQPRKLPAEPARQLARLPGPLLAERQIHPTEPMEISLAPACDPSHHTPGTGDDQPTPAQAIRQQARMRAATGPASLFGAEGIHAEELNQRLLGHLCTGTPVDDCELLLHMIDCKVSFHDQPDMIQVGDQELIEALVEQGPQQRISAFGVLPHNTLCRLIKNPVLARDWIRYNPNYFNHASPEIKTRDMLAKLLVGMSPLEREYLLHRIMEKDLDMALSLASTQELTKLDPDLVLRHLQPCQQTTELHEIAVRRKPELLRQLQASIDEEEYEKLCDQLLDLSGSFLKFIEPCQRTAERVDRAVAHKSPANIEDIPEHLRNETRLQLALKNVSPTEYASQISLLTPKFLTQWNLWDTLKRKENWLRYIPESERSDALFLEYTDQYPMELYRGYVPAAVERLRPQWAETLWQPGCYRTLANNIHAYHKQLDAAALNRILVDGSAVLHDRFRFPPDAQIPAWALLVEGFQEKLAPEDKALIWRNGGTSGLGDAFNVPAFRIDPLALLDPVQEPLCTYRATCLPGQVVKKLMFCHPFQPPNAALGVQLHQDMTGLAQELHQAIRSGQLQHWPYALADSAATWEIRGGRTLARKEGNLCVHMKFQRRGESLESFSAEQAVQNFAQQAHETLGWHGEIPTPGGIWLVPLDALPVASQEFPDAPETYNYEGRDYVLALRFTTKDDSYDTLAWQPDETGGFSKSSEGLLKAFHDLGVWSSLGALHTSTIRLYHHFLDLEGASRPELVLNTCFQPGQLYPGTLHLWNTKATQQSDWGESGLRDLGDIELYPLIHTYVKSLNAKSMVPDYGQRASFVNAIAQNILGGLLHYMRLHRACDPDYHYKNATSVKNLAHFIEQSCNTFLEGLLGEKVPLEQLFEETQQGLAEVYPEWLRRTAEEIIYWSARQDNNSDCFAEHLNKEGRPSPQLYPGHPRQHFRYGAGENDDYTEAAGES
ncbi:MAG: hypothetical protein OXC07_04180, partial [Kistimonas sp.]|nr:hypothetical protein [Kistimonas sp.]